jgi:acyl carrier protein
MTDEEFYGKFIALLQEIRPASGLNRLQPNTHLWEAGYLDSLAMLEVIFFLEETLGRELQLSGNFLPTFFTMRRIYDAHVAPVLTTAGPDRLAGERHQP